MSKRALVIGCGGVAGGAWTTAMLAAYAEATGNDPRESDIIVGTSAGAVMAALLGGGISVDQLVTAQRREQVTLGSCVWNHNTATGGALPPVPGSWPGAGKLALLGLRGKVSGLTAMSGLLPRGTQDLSLMGELVDNLANGERWVQHPNTWVVGVDCQTGERVAFGSDSAPKAKMSDAVRASYAVPGWCPPVEIAGRDYMDGGIVSPTSADLVLGQDIDEVVVMPPMVSQQLDSPRHPAMRIERVLRKVMTRRVNWEVEQLKRAGLRVIRLEPSPEDLTAFGYNMMDPARRRQVFDTAMRTSPRVVRAAGLK